MCIFHPYRYTTDLLQKGGHGIVNLCSDDSVWCAHDGKTSMVKSAPVLTEEDPEKVPHPALMQS